MSVYRWAVSAEWEIISLNQDLSEMMKWQAGRLSKYRDTATCDWHSTCGVRDPQSGIWQCLRTRKSERVRGRRPEGMNEDSSRRTGLLSGEKALDATEGRRMLKEKGVR